MYVFSLLDCQKILSNLITDLPHGRIDLQLITSLNKYIEYEKQTSHTHYTYKQVQELDNKSLKMYINFGKGICSSTGTRTRKTMHVKS